MGALENTKTKTKDSVSYNTDLAIILLVDKQEKDPLLTPEPISPQINIDSQESKKKLQNLNYFFLNILFLDLKFC